MSHEMKLCGKKFTDDNQLIQNKRVRSIYILTGDICNKPHMGPVAIEQYITFLCPLYLVITV